MGGQPLYLAPRLGEKLRSLLESGELLHTLTDALGSPLDLILPDQLAANVEQFRSVHRRHHGVRVLSRRPEPGDLLAFANTAGYCMDFHATHAQQQPVARKAAAWQEGGAWRWCLDDEYWPISSVGGAQ